MESLEELEKLDHGTLIFHQDPPAEIANIFNSTIHRLNKTNSVSGQPSLVG